MLTGVSGAGKTTLINELLTMDQKFVLIKAYTTREIRDKYDDRIKTSQAELENMNKNNDMLIFRKVYGNTYGIPSKPILEALRDNRFPVTDFPIQEIRLPNKALSPQQVYCVYIEPGDKKKLFKKLYDERRNNINERIDNVNNELKMVNKGEYDEFISYKVKNILGKKKETASKIYDRYMHSLNM